MVGVGPLEIVDCLLEGDESLHSHALVEGEVGLVSHAVFCGGVDYLLVEGEDGVFGGEQVLRDFLDVGVESDAKECFLRENLFYEFFSGHSVMKCFFVCLFYSSFSFILSAFSSTVSASIIS